MKYFIFDAIDSTILFADTKQRYNHVFPISGNYWQTIESMLDRDSFIKETGYGLIVTSIDWEATIKATMDKATQMTDDLKQPLSVLNPMQVKEMLVAVELLKLPIIQDLTISVSEVCFFAKKHSNWSFYENLMRSLNWCEVVEIQKEVPIPDEWQSAIKQALASQKDLVKAVIQ